MRRESESHSAATRPQGRNDDHPHLQQRGQKLFQTGDKENRRYVRRRYGTVAKQKEYRGGCHTAAALLFLEPLLGFIIKAHLM